MTQMIALCIEDLGEGADARRFVSCVALPRGNPGLGLDASGRATWADPGPGTAAWLFVREDGRLALRLAVGAGGARILRAGRELVVPEGSGSDAILLDGDVLAFGGRKIGLHVHGPAQAAHAPRPVEDAGAPPGEEPSQPVPPQTQVPVLQHPPAVALPPVNLIVTDSPPEPSNVDEARPAEGADLGWEPDIKLPEDEPEH